MFYGQQTPGYSAKTLDVVGQNSLTALSGAELAWPPSLETRLQPNISKLGRDEPLKNEVPRSPGIDPNTRRSRWLTPRPAHGSIRTRSLGRSGSVRLDLAISNNKLTLVHHQTKCRTASQTPSTTRSGRSTAAVRRRLSTSIRPAMSCTRLSGEKSPQIYPAMPLTFFTFRTFTLTSIP